MPVFNEKPRVNTTPAPEQQSKSVRQVADNRAEAQSQLQLRAVADQYASKSNNDKVIHNEPNAPGVVQRVREVGVKRSQTLLQDAEGGKKSGTMFEWDSIFSVAVVSNKVMVTIRIKSDIDPVQFNSVWAKQVHEQWSNRFMISAAGKNYPIVVNIEQVESGEHYTVAAVDTGSALSSGSRGHFGTENMLTWGVNDTTNISHEVGHMLGNVDEYGKLQVGSEVRDYSLNPSETIMGTPKGNPIQEHYYLIKWAAEQELGSDIGSSSVLPDMSARMGGSASSFSASDISGGLSRLKPSGAKTTMEEPKEPSALEKARAGLKKPSARQEQVMEPAPDLMHADTNVTVTRYLSDTKAMLDSLRMAREKKDLYVSNWTISKLIEYIENTIAQYESEIRKPADELNSAKWCVNAAAQFCKDIDQVIVEEKVRMLS